MAINRWNPSQIVSRQEKFILGRLKRNGKLYAFLRQHRHQLFDDAFQHELEAMYRDTGAGKDAHPPALMAMVVLLQSYAGASDATAVELSLLDLRWQMVLDCLGAVEPVFSQGALFDFRERLIAANLDRRLLERSRELAAETKAFDPKKLPKMLRVAMDSSPLEGAGRVEDTVNLLAHAGRKIVACVAELRGWTEERVCREAGCPLLVASSVKAALDLDWSDPTEKATAIPTLIEQLTSLEQWLTVRLPDEVTHPRSTNTSRPCIRSSNRISSPTPVVAAACAFARASQRIGASPSRTRKCGTAAKRNRSASTATSATSRSIWTRCSSWL
jgi:hypothetical protein